VDGLERELQGRAQVVRLNIHDRVGQQARQLFGVRMVPAFIVFDTEGRERWRQSGEFPNRKAILQALGEGEK
jgi:hypothetical protein